MDKKFMEFTSQKLLQNTTEFKNIKLLFLHC